MTSSSASYNAYRALNKFPHLDGLRACCILPVIFHHTAGGLALGRLGERGALGVDMFFVISGFLIVTLLLREQAQTQTLSLFNFYVRRTLRIMPLYYGIIALCMVAYSVAPKSQSAQAFFAELPYYLTYSSNWFPVTTLLAISWSLAAEEQFYLIWPPLQKMLRRPVYLAVSLLVISQLIHFGCLDALLAKWGLGPDQPKMLRRTGFTPILLGVLLAHALHSERGFLIVNRVLGRRAAPVVLVVMLFVMLLALPVDLQGWPRLSIHLLLTLFLASVVVRADHLLAPVLSFPALVRVGVLSYGMYLWHVLAIEAVVRALARVHLSSLWLFPATALLTYAIAELSYRYYESFFLRLKARFHRSRSAMAPLRNSQPSQSV
jgi:peptidoglycan/LPS O-acetylase OafA/YrhL